MRNYFLLSILFLASCLPQEKVTQCGKNEAFDATKRKCVATLSISDTTNISSISPANSYTVSPNDANVTHSVTVSDPFDNGFQLKWYLTSPNGNRSLFSVASSVTFPHTTFSGGSYVLEVQLFDKSGVTSLDARSWTINVIDNELPVISPVTASPFTTRMTSSPTTVSAVINNPDSISNIDYQWFVNGSAVSGESGTIASATAQTLNFTFDPASSSSYFAGAGVYSLTLSINEDGSGFQYDNYTWTIQNNPPEFANISVGSSAVFGRSTPVEGSSIMAIDEISILNEGFLNSSGLAIDFCVQADDVGGVDNNGVFVDFKIDGNNIPGASNIQLTADNTSFCLSTFNDYFYDILTQATQQHDLEAVVYDKYTGSSNLPDYNGFTEVSRLKWFLNVRAKNSKPVVTIDSVNTTLPCTSSTTVSATGCTITQDTSFTLAITVSDDDYDPYDFSAGGEFEKFRVEFYVDNSLIDGTSALSPDDCYRDFTDTLENSEALRYRCNLSINSHDTNGPVDVTGLSYTISARVTDLDSPYITPDNQTSESVNWVVNTVNVSNTTPTINEFATDNGDYLGDTTQSYISLQATPGTAVSLSAGTVSERDVIQFHVNVDEAERDSHNIKIERCEDIACSSVVIPEIASTVVNSTDNTNPRRTTINHQISESEVQGAATGNIYYRITVTDIVTETGVPNVTSSSEIITLRVNNNNPDPQFDPSNFVPAQPANLIAFAGFPITIDPGAVTDISITDGEVVTYQWMIDPGTGYEPINGATERVLVWTPGPELDFSTQSGVAVSIKLCFGDNGTNSSGSAKDPMNGSSNDCLTPTLDSGDWDLTVFSNIFAAGADDGITTAHRPEGGIATWVDPTSTDPVITYTAFVSTAKQIVVEKNLIFADGTKQGSMDNVNELFSVSFSATNSPTPPSSVTNLSIAGDPVNGSLYISYMAPVSGVDRVQVRRIDISGDKTGLQHPGKFDFSYIGLDNFITVAGDITKSVNGNTMDLTLNNNVNGSAQFNLHNSAVNFVMGTNFCTGGCATTDAAASELADAINSSASNIIQGITASVSGSVVTLEGMEANDFLDVDLEATRIGKIMVNQTAGQWQLPLIDHGLGGGDKHKISIAQGNLGVNLSNSLSTKSFLAGTAPAEELVNELAANDSMILATRGYTTGDIAVFELNSNLSIIDVETDLFNDDGIYDLRLSVGHATNNQKAFLLGFNANSDDRIAYARFDSTNNNFDINGAIINLDLDSGFSLLDRNNVEHYDISAGADPYQLHVAVNDTSTQSAYLLQVREFNPIVNCNYDNSVNSSITKCTKLLAERSDVIPNVPLVLSKVVESITLGDAGATANENQQPIMILQMHRQNGVNNQVIGGVINSKGTTITANETSAGNSFNTPYVAP